MTAATTDALLVAAWIALAADGLWMARRARPAGPPLWARLAALALLLVGVAVLEQRSGGRIAFHPVAAGAGIALAAAGLLLHGWARRALGSHWSSSVGVPEGHPVVTRGPYGVVRHPIYLGVLSIAAGTAIAHPSAATACVTLGLAAGMAWKIPAEERAMRAACGDAWRRYAAAVPALVPRPRRVSRGSPR